MFEVVEELIPNLTGNKLMAIFLVVVFTEIVKKLLDEFNFKHEKKILAGSKFVLPLAFSVGASFVLFQIEDIKHNEIISNICIIYGVSVATYEMIVKRVGLTRKSNNSDSKSDSENDSKDDSESEE